MGMRFAIPSDQRIAAWLGMRLSESTRIAASGEAPLDYMIRVMRDETAPVKRRDEMAKAAAPYVHPRLAAIEHSGQLPTKPAHLMTDDELAAIAAGGPSSSNQVPVDPKLVN
jgi:hypothetical protein